MGDEKELQGLPSVMKKLCLRGEQNEVGRFSDAPIMWKTAAMMDIPAQAWAEVVAFAVGGGRLGLGTIVVLGLLGYALGIDPRILIGGAEMIAAGAGKLPCRKRNLIGPRLNPQIK